MKATTIMCNAASGQTWLKAIGTLVACFFLTMTSQAVELKAYTEEWPPYNFEEAGRPRGIATDLLRAACAQAEIDCEIAVVPWARTYKLASETPNTLVYSTARNAEREANFIWIGPILPRTTWIYGKAGLERSVHTLKDLDGLRIGVVRGEAAQQDLLNAGLAAANFRLESSNADVLKLLHDGVVDVMIDTEIGMGWNLRNANWPLFSPRKLMKLSDDGAYYFALNPQSDPALAKRLQQAIDKLRKDGKLAAIIKRYTAQAVR